MDKGFIHVYTGRGKGKTTAALGLAIRALGAGLKVYIGQFLKSRNSSEIKFLSDCNHEITIEQFGCSRQISSLISDEDKDAAIAGFSRIKQLISKGDFDLIILDEINVVMNYGLIPVGDVVKLLKQRPVGCEVVLTGRDVPAEIVKIADLVSEIKDVKHYYAKDVPARLGIEK